MKEKNMKKVRMVKIEYDYNTTNWSHTTICDIDNYIETINYLVGKGIKINKITFYE